MVTRLRFSNRIMVSPDCHASRLRRVEMNHVLSWCHVIHLAVLVHQTTRQIYHRWCRLYGYIVVRTIWIFMVRLLWHTKPQIYGHTYSKNKLSNVVLPWMIASFASRILRFWPAKIVLSGNNSFTCSEGWAGMSLVPATLLSLWGLPVKQGDLPIKYLFISIQFMMMVWWLQVILENSIHSSWPVIFQLTI